MTLLAMLFTAWKRRRAKRAAFAELSRMDDRMLRDIDFSRAEIERYGRGAAYRDFA